MTLIGTSLGARLIFACLEEIARRHELWEEQVRGEEAFRGATPERRFGRLFLETGVRGRRRYDRRWVKKTPMARS